MKIYADICIQKYARLCKYMHVKNANICNLYALYEDICNRKYMQKYVIENMHKYEDICKNMHKIICQNMQIYACKLYANICNLYAHICII